MKLQTWFYTNDLSRSVKSERASQNFYWLKPTRILSFLPVRQGKSLSTRDLGRSTSILTTQTHKKKKKTSAMQFFTTHLLCFTCIHYYEVKRFPKKKKKYTLNSLLGILGKISGNKSLELILQKTLTVPYRIKLFPNTQNEQSVEDSLNTYRIKSR